MLKVKRSNSQEYEIFIKKSCIRLYSLEIKDSNSIIKVRAILALIFKKDIIRLPEHPGFNYPFLFAEKQ